MDFHRKVWNEQQKALRQSLTSLENPSVAIEIFLRQHAMLHAAGMSGMALYSFEDETLAGLTDQQMRTIPRNLEHSIAWVVWHSTRIEDATLNLLVAGRPQVLLEQAWFERLGISERDTSNAMEPAAVAALSAAIHLPALRDYRRSVGCRTRLIVKQLGAQELIQKVDPARLENMRSQAAVRPEAGDLLEYWSGLTITGLLLMPPTRHAFVHWNEALRIKQKMS
jgi:hypothetical protein